MFADTVFLGIFHYCFILSKFDRGFLKWKCKISHQMVAAFYSQHDSKLVYDFACSGTYLSVYIFDAVGDVLRADCPA